MFELEMYMNNNQKSCKTLKETAFDSHPSCYVNSDPGFCEVILDSDNWDGFIKVFQANDFLGEDREYAMRQVGLCSF